MENNNSPILEERIVCFIDILGFAAMIAAAGRNDLSMIKKIDDALGLIQEIGQKVQVLKGSNPVVHIFSDSAIIVTDTSNKAMAALCMALADLVIDLSLIGVFIRGGISVGNVSSNAKRPWGPAIVDAYHIEDKVAKHPRVVLHRKGHELLKKSAKDLLANGLVRRDPVDGVFFIDAYEYRIGKHHPHYPAEARKYSNKELESIRDNITHAHDDAVDAPKVYKKLEWLRDRWDKQFPIGGGRKRYRTPHGKGLDLTERERISDIADSPFFDAAHSGK